MGSVQMTEMGQDLVTTEFWVNGEPIAASAPSRMLLSDYIRETLGLTATHVGCEQGVCGACTVLIDGRPVRSCLQFVAQMVDRSVTTLEGINSADGRLTPLQEAMHAKDALQCGFCTPGFVVTATALLSQIDYATRDEIAEVLSGNVCRCGCYEEILDAVESVVNDAAGSGG